MSTISDFLFNKQFVFLARMNHSLRLLFVVMLMCIATTASAQKKSRALVEATYELIDLMNVDSSMREIMALHLDKMIENQPQFEPYRDVFQDFYTKELDFEFVKEQIAELYMMKFDEAEIRDLILFYKSSTGQKIQRLEGELSVAMIDIGQQMFFRNAHVLESMIRQRDNDLRIQFATSIDLFEFIKGRWDYTTDEPACTVNPFTLDVVEDRTQFINRSEPNKDSDSTHVSIYDVLEVTPEYIRGRIQGEERLTESGEPVIWDIIPLNEQSFCWRRADWPSENCTAPIIRCD